MKIALILILALVATTSYSQWITNNIGTIPAGNAYDVDIADGRNDGVQRVYVSSRSDGLYEFSYDDNSNLWNRTTVYNGVSQANIIQLEVGACRNDGVNRIYSVEWNHNGGHIYESTWSGTTWNTVDVAIEVDGITEIMIGNGRNDCVNRLYIGGYAGVGFNEYSWDGAMWQRVHLFDFTMEGSGVVGDLKASGQNAVYSTGEYLTELNWSGSLYDSINVTQDFMWPDPFDMGNCRNDGVNRLFANTNKGRREIAYNSGNLNWDVTVIGNNGKRGDVCLEKLKSDGLNAIYSTYSKGWNYANDHFVEYKWNGSSYDSTKVLDATSGATAMIGAGFGRNDDTMRMYVPNYVGNTVLELTWADPYVITPSIVAQVKEDDFEFTAFYKSQSIMIDIKNKPASTSKVEMYSLNGKFIFSKTLEHDNNNVYINGVNAGLYILKVTSGDVSKSKKIVIM